MQHQAGILHPDGEPVLEDACGLLGCGPSVEQTGWHLVLPDRQRLLQLIQSEAKDSPYREARRPLLLRQTRPGTVPFRQDAEDGLDGVRFPARRWRRGVQERGQTLISGAGFLIEFVFGQEALVIEEVAVQIDVI